MEDINWSYTYHFHDESEPLSSPEVWKTLYNGNIVLLKVKRNVQIPGRNRQTGVALDFTIAKPEEDLDNNRPFNGFQGTLGIVPPEGFIFVSGTFGDGTSRIWIPQNGEVKRYAHTYKPLILSHRDLFQYFCPLLED